MSERVLHCWKDEAEHITETFGTNSDEYFDYWCKPDETRGGTCLLPKGHEGPHEFSLNSEITIAFADQQEWCDNCGLCCMHMRTPPFAGGSDPRWKDLPQELAIAIAAQRLRCPPAEVVCRYVMTISSVLAGGRQRAVGGRQ